MNYKETITFLFNSLPVYQREGRAAYKGNLNNTLALDKFLGEPHKTFKTIHVAGTNGKGSVSHMLASVFQQAGYKTGLYTSPHLLDFRERIKVNGQEVSTDFVVNFVEHIKPQIAVLQPSFFEMTVAMAFAYFRDQQVDIAIIETGLGGRLDSTNIIHPLASVITNIGLDHTQFLGDTMALIAAEKAGIIKPGVPVIIGESNAVTHPLFIDVAKERTSDILFAEEHLDIISQENKKGKQTVTIRQHTHTLTFDLDLLGAYQSRNLITTLTCLEALRPVFKHLNMKNIREGLKNVIPTTGLRGRWEIMQHDPMVICDTGHNTEGIELIVDQLKTISFNHLHIVWGMVNDKATHAILSLLPKDADYYFTQAAIPRAKDASELKKEANVLQLKGKAYTDVPTAYRAALKNAKINDLVFVGGSNFVVADFLSDSTI